MSLDSLFISSYFLPSLHLLTSFAPSLVSSFSLFCLVSFDLSSRVQVRPSQRTTVTQRPAGPAPSAPAWCGWRRPAPTPTTPSASATTTSSSTRYPASVSRAPCARWVRVCMRTANMITTRRARSAWTIPTLTGKAPSTPACPAPSVTRTARYSWRCARQTATLSVTVSLPHTHRSLHTFSSGNSVQTKDKKELLSSD